MVKSPAWLSSASKAPAYESHCLTQCASVPTDTNVYTTEVTPQRAVTNHLPVTLMQSAIGSWLVAADVSITAATVFSVSDAVKVSK
jgi:hypothetical protein